MQRATFRLTRIFFGQSSEDRRTANFAKSNSTNIHFTFIETICAKDNAHELCCLHTRSSAPTVGSGLNLLCEQLLGDLVRAVTSGEQRGQIFACQHCLFSSCLAVILSSEVKSNGLLLLRERDWLTASLHLKTLQLPSRERTVG